MSKFEEKRLRNLNTVAQSNSEVQRQHDLIMSWLAESGTDQTHLAELQNYIYELTTVKIPTASLRNFFLDRCNQNPLVPPGGIRGVMMCGSWKDVKLARPPHCITKRPR